MTQYAQTAVKVEELRLPGLDGMLPGGKVKAREKVALDHLMEAADEITDKYAPIIKDIWHNASMYDQDHLINACYMDIYDFLRNKRLKHVQFDENTLSNLIYMKSTKKNKKDDFSYKPNALGLYTGCLLQLLTERNRAAGLPTSFYFNGEGERFDYLFNHAKNVDEIIVDNFRGKQLCSYIASFGGNVNKIMLTNCDGFYSNSGEKIASYDGRAGYIIGINNSRCEFKSCVQNEGKVHTFIMVGNKFSNPELNLDKNIWWGRGYADLFISVDNYCPTITSISVHAYGMGLFVGWGNYDIHPTQREGLTFPILEGDLFLCDRVSTRDDETCFSRWDEDLGKLITIGKGRRRYGVDGKLAFEESPEKFSKLIENYKVNELIRMSKSLKTMDPKQIFKAVDKIYSTYQSVKPLIEEAKKKKREEEREKKITYRWKKRIKRFFRGLTK